MNEVSNAKAVVAAGIARKAPGDVRGPDELRVVDDDRDTVAAELNIELRGIGALNPG